MFFIILIFITISCFQEAWSPVHGARVHSLVVMSQRNRKGLVPTTTTLASLATMASLGKHGALRIENDQDVMTARGVKLRRLAQTYGGYEVYGSVVTAEVTMDGHYTGHMSGEIVLDISDDVPDPEVCQRDVNDVIDVALKAEGLAKGDKRVRDRDGRRFAYLNQVNGKAVMAYIVDFFVGEIVKRPLYIIDACDDTIYATFNLIQNSTDHRHLVEVVKRQNEKACGDCDPSVPGHGGNRKIGRVAYGNPPYCLKVSQNGSSCTMQSLYVQVVNNMGSTLRNFSNPVSFTCSSGYTDPFGNKNGAYGIANDAMYFGHITGEFYFKKYSFRALSWVPRLVVHYGSNYQNAFWTGRDMFFGDGSFFRRPYVCLDIIAHELAHGITSTNSKLIYKDQSGGINEAFSDLSGEVIEHYTRGGNDWYVGADITKFRKAIRYFSDPTRDGRSIKHTKDYFAGLDVHYSSGVFNHAFYRMIRIYGINIYDAYECFLDANRSRWGRNTGFDAGACHVMRACYAKGYNTDYVRSAFTNVGISFSGCSLSLHEAALYSGDTRSNVLVSSTTNPILELHLDKGKRMISALAEDRSVVTLALAADEEARSVMDERAGSLEVESSQDDTVLYVQLKSSNRSKTKVVLKVT